MYYKIAYYENSDRIECYSVSTMNGYTKNKLYQGSTVFMYTSDVEAGVERFKKQYLKSLDNKRDSFNNARIKIKTE